VEGGAAYADYDNNGTLDILVTENNGPAHLIKNNNFNNYLRVKIKSINSNRDGVGTKLIAITKDGRMIRKVKTGSSFMSHSETTITFGLGENRAVDSLYVYWPNNKTDIFLDIESSQEILLVESNEN
jgi:ASPIC and UnbV.